MKTETETETETEIKVKIETDGFLCLVLEYAFKEKVDLSRLYVECTGGDYKLSNDCFYWSISEKWTKERVILHYKEKIIEVDLCFVKDMASKKLESVQNFIAENSLNKNSSLIYRMFNLKSNGSSLIDRIFNLKPNDSKTLVKRLKNTFLENENRSGYVVLNKVSAFADREREIYYHPGYPEYEFTLPINWSEEASPYNKRSWQYGFNSWVFMDSLLVHEDVSNFRFAIDIALDWYEFNVEGVVFNKFAWYDMSVAFRATRLPHLIVVGILNDLLTEEKLYKLCVLLELHIVDLCDETKLAKHSNHGLYQLAGVLAISNILPEIKKSKLIKSYATSNLIEILNKDVNDEGLHLEHSPAYHVYITEIFNAIVSANWVDDDNLKRKVELMGDVSSLLSHPNGKVVRFGDTSERHVAQVFKKDPNEYVRYIVSKGQKGTSPEFLNNIFPKSGYAYFRSNWGETDWEEQSFLAYSSAFHKRTHKHADDFNFEWSELGQRILVDAGMFGYERDAVERLYVQSTRAHNCVEIDETDYSLYNLDIYGSAMTAWSDSSDVKVVESYLYRKRFFKTKHRRLMLFNPAKWLLVIDTLSSNDRHKYTQWFHFHPDLNLFNSLEESYVDFKGKRLWVSSFNEGEKSEHIKAQFEPRLQGWTSMEPYKLTPNDALGFTVEDKKEHTFATLFSFGCEAEKPELKMFKSSSNGKYLRAKWKTPSGEQQDIIYRIASGSRDFTINGEAIDITVRELEK